MRATGNIICAIGVLAACVSAAWAAPVSYWSLDDAPGSAAAANTVGGGPVATLNNMDTTGAWVAGHTGGALAFDGVNDFAEAVLNISENANTVSMWIRTSAPAGGFFSVNNSANLGQNDRNLYVNGGNVYGRIWSEETVGSASSGINFADGAWHHVVHVYGPGTTNADNAPGKHRLYVDGVQLGGGSKSYSDFNWQDIVRFGWANPPGVTNFFNGAIDDVAVYDSVLTPSQVMLLRQGANPMTVESAPQVVWTGTIGPWETAANWTSNPALPGATDEAVINNGGTAQVTASTGTALSNILTIGGTGPGTVSLSGGLIQSNLVTIAAGGLLTVSGGGLNVPLLQMDGGTLRADVSFPTSQAIAMIGAAGGTVDTNGNNISHDGTIIGGGGLTKAGAGTLLLAGTAANTFSGTTTLSGGKLVLGKTAGVNAIGGNLTIATSGGWIVGATNGTGVELLADEQIPNTATMTFSGSDWGGFRPQGHTETIAGLSCTSGWAVIENVGYNNGAPTPDGTLIINNSSDFTYNGWIRDRDNAGSSKINIVKSGAGRLTFGRNPAEANNARIYYTGTTTINGGTLALVDLNSPSRFNSPITVNAGGTLELNSSVAFATRWLYYPAIGGTGTVNKTGTGAFQFSGPVSLSGTVNVLAGRLGSDNLIANYAANTATLVISGGAEFDLRGQPATWGGLGGAGNVINSYGFGGANVLTIGAGDKAGTFTGSITGSGNGSGGDGDGLTALRKIGTGAQYLDGASTYTGTTTVVGGYLVARNNAAIGAGPAGLTVESGATFQLEHATAVTISGKTATITGLGVGGTRGALASWSGDNTWSGPVVMTGDSSVFVNSASLTLPGVVSGNYNLTKTGAGKLVLGGPDANTFSGTTTVSGGKIVLSKPAGTNAIGGNLVIASPSGWSNATTGVDLGASEQIPDSAVITFSGADWCGFRPEGFTETVAGLASPGGKGLIENSGQTQGPSVSVDGTVIIRNTADFSFSGIIRDNDGGNTTRINLVKDGSGTQTLVGGNIIYTGTTIVNGGTLLLSSTPGYKSPTTVNGGVLEIAGAANYEHDAWTGDFLTLNNGATLRKTNTGYDTINHGNVVVNGSVTIDIINSGVDNQFFMGSSGGGLTGSGNITVNNTGGATTGLTLRYGVNASHFAGAVRVNGGALNFGAGGGLTLDNADLTLAGARMTMDSSAFAAGGATNVSLRSLTGDSTSSIGLGSQVLTLGANNGTGGVFAGALPGAGSLVKTGSGTQTLAGSGITYAGPTSVQGGRLVLQDTAAFTSVITLSNNATAELRVTGGSQTYSGGVAGTGDLVKSGAGTLVAQGAHTYSGQTIISEGTYRLAMPTMPGGAALWLDATDASTVLISGGTVYQWNDKSGSGNNLAQIDTARQPTLASAVMNNRPAVRFDGNDSLFKSFSVGTLYTIFSASKMDGGQNARLITAVSNNWLLGYWQTYKNQMYAVGWVNQPITPADTATHLYGANGNGALTYFYDGPTLLAANANGTAAPSGLSLGAWNNGEASKGSVGEIVLYGSILTDLQRQDLTAYLAHKWVSSQGIIPDASPVTIGAGAVLDLNNLNETIGSLAGPAGGTVLLGGATLTLSGTASTAYAGAVTGPGSLVKAGSGSQFFNGPVGTSGVSVPVAVNAGLLGGTGPFSGPITIGPGGEISAGNSPGHLVISGSPAFYDYVQTGSMLAEIGGTQQGVNYDWIEVFGRASLAGTINIDWSNFIGLGTFRVLTATEGIDITGPLALDYSGARYGQYEWRYSIVPWGQGGQALQLDLVPEPATMLLMMLGIPAAASRIRRRMRR